MIAAEMQYHNDIQQGGGTIEKMNMIKHQSLYQHEHHKGS